MINRLNALFWRLFMNAESRVIDIADNNYIDSMDNHYKGKRIPIKIIEINESSFLQDCEPPSPQSDD